MEITPEWLMDLETEMRTIQTDNYQRLNKDLWWERVTKRRTTGSKKERITWLLETAKIERPNASRGGGQAIFEDIVGQTQEIEVENAVAGLKLKKEKFLDLDGNGYDLAAHWSKQVGAYAAYWPQEQVADAIKANPVCYDTTAFFSSAHPYNPYKTGLGVFSNDLTGAPSGAYPGAVPLNGVTVDVALENLHKARAYVSSLKMPNGKTPRRLKVRGILHPPALGPILQQLTQAQFIAQAAASGGGSGDVSAIISNYNMGLPIEAEELGAAFGGSDTDYYLMVEEIISDDHGAFIYTEREEFGVIWHGEMTDAALARKKEYEWTTEGRNIVSPGHPYLLFRCRAT